MKLHENVSLQSKAWDIPVRLLVADLDQTLIYYTIYIQSCRLDNTIMLHLLLKVIKLVCGCVNDILKGCRLGRKLVRETDRV